MYRFPTHANSVSLKVPFYLFLIAIILSTQSFSQKKTLFIIADGIPADVIEKTNTPALDEIAKSGGYSRAIVGGEKDQYNQTPTISAVGYNSVLTGTWVNKHNVWDNDIVAPNYNYPTIFRLLKEQRPDAKIGIFSSWADNRTKLVGEEIPAAGNLKFDYVLDSLEYDSINFKQDDARDFMRRIDDSVANYAASTIRNSAPDLSWVYLEYTDDMGHMFGDSPQFTDAVVRMDRQVGLIYESIKYRQKNFGEEWLIIITTDHGRDSITGHNHGGQSNRERLGWIVTNAQKKNQHFTGNSLSIVDIMPSIAEHLKLTIPRNNLIEVDGTSFIGEIFADNLKANITGNEILITWRPFSKGKGKIWLSTSNEYYEGGKDKYELINLVDISKGHAKIKIKGKILPFYKIAFEKNGQFLNRWITTSSQSKN